MESGLKKLRIKCPFAGYMWTEGESAKKKLRIKQYQDTCGRGLNVTLKSCKMY